MPNMKITLNGRKYVISGVTERTSSKHILCSLARVDSTFHLETTCTEFSDTSVENVEWNKRTRTTRTRRTRVRHSSTSSLEVVVKNPPKGTSSQKNVLIDLEKSDKENGSWNSEKCSRKLLFSDNAKQLPASKNLTCNGHATCGNCHAMDGESHAKCNGCHTKTGECDSKCNECHAKTGECHAKTGECHEKTGECHAKTGECHEKCNECHAITGECHAKCNECHAMTEKCHATCAHAKKTEVKKRRRKTRKRPVSQDVTGCKEKKESKNKEKMELGGKGWRSADDVRESGNSFSVSDETTQKRNEKHKKKRKSKHDKIDKKSCNDHQKVVVHSIDNPSEYRRVYRHVRKELGDLRIQRMVSRAIDQRFVDFHVSCIKSYGHHHHSNDHHSNYHHSSEQEIRSKLMKLIESQRKCLTALEKAEKQNRKAVSRYSKYLELDQDKIQFYSFPHNDAPPVKVERTRKTSDTDTGISELHSDSESSSDSKHTHIYDVYKRDATIDYVISDDFFPDDVMEKKPTKIDGAEDDVIKDDVISCDKVTSNGTQRMSTPNYVITVDAVAIDDVTHGIRKYTYEKDDDTQSEIIVAQPIEVISFDQSEETSSLVPYQSAESINVSTLSDISDRGFHGNSDDVFDVEELRKILMQEQQKQQEKKRKIDRRCEEMRLMDLRIEEHEKMADILERLKVLNDGALEHEENDLTQEKRNLKKSKKLSVNLYEYQKGEMNKNAASLQQIESQISRKRWHVESAVKELGQVVSSLSLSQMDRIRSLKDLTGFTGLSTTNAAEFKRSVDGTLV